MRTDIWYDSKGAGKIHGCRWSPEGEPRAVVQIIHGIAEFAERYDDFAEFLTRQGFLVVAEDHMGHGQSINGEGIQGYFHGGWFTAVGDCLQLMADVKAEFPGIPYILFGHSMGSFLARTILCKYPQCGLTGAVICGTGWQPAFALPAVIKLVEGFCKKDETKPNGLLQKLVFGSYNRKVEHPRTEYDWLSRDSKIVDEYIAHPLCGFTASAGLMRDMLQGISFIQQKKNLQNMNKALPVLFLAGGDDPVGSYGTGVYTCAEAFQKAGMEQVSIRIYPMGRHEILNEINRKDVYEDVHRWMEKCLKEGNKSV